MASQADPQPPAVASPDQRFRGLLESAPDAIVIVDESGTIRIVNGQAEKLFGYEREQLIGQKVEILVPAELRETHAEHRSHYVADPRTRPMGIGMDLVAQRKDGSRFPVEISLSPLRTEEGMLVTSVVRNITDRREAERRLRESERRFRELIEGTDDLVVRLDGEGRFIYLNHAAERIFGLTPQEGAGRSSFDFVHPDDRATAMEAFRRLSGERVSGTTFENRQVSREGRITHMLWTVNPRYDEQGRLSSVTAVGRDVTDRTRVEEAEREAIEARAELRTERIESEMRREVLRRSIAAQEEERRRIARELHDETAQALTGVLLGLGRIESADELSFASEEARRMGDELSNALGELRGIAMRLRPTILDHFGLVPALERLVEQTAAGDEERVRFEHSLERRLDPEVETTVYRVVQEALNNAAKHAAASEIRVEVRDRDGAVSATIEDDGRGFDAELARREGLGITGMQERAELVGGKLVIASSPAAGTRVALRVPVERA